MMWQMNHKGELEFAGGRESWDRAVSCASGCQLFREDVDEECVADEVVSCYNCRYRRWTSVSFTCAAKRVSASRFLLRAAAGDESLADHAGQRFF